MRIVPPTETHRVKGKIQGYNTGISRIGFLDLVFLLFRVRDTGCSDIGPITKKHTEKTIGHEMALGSYRGYIEIRRE